MNGWPVLKLSRGASTASFTLQAGLNVRLSNLNLDSAGRPTFVHTTHVNAKTADAFRRAGVQFLDSAGNTWIQFGDVLIDIRGRISTEPDRTSLARRAAGDVFSSGRSQVIMALLAWPDLWRRPQRELAEAAGVSLGQTNKTLALLEQAGRGPGRRKRQEVSLLDMWAAALPGGLGQRLYLGSYHGDITWRPSRDERDPPAVSGKSAVPELLRPGSLTLYVRELDPKLAMRQRWRADGEPNVIVRRKFWRTPRWMRPARTMSSRRGR
ncbi:MAG: type IV toxin-antitoxin system AbiEi family antitoxin [Jatrophihabitantaceae bacterium]